NISLKASPNSKQCVECYRNRKGKTHKQCPLCPPERAHHLRCPIGQAACSDCLLRKQPKVITLRSSKRAIPESAEPVFQHLPKKSDIKNVVLRRAVTSSSQYT